MRLDNRWKRGSRALVVPPLPPRLHGMSGCLLARAIFDDSVGVETYLAILEEPSWCLPIAGTRPFKLFCKSGLAQTRHGGLIFLLWRVAAESPAETVREQFLNPNRVEVLKDLWALAHQTHLKALIINSRASEVVDWFEFENDYGFDGLLQGVMQTEPSDGLTDFDAAMAEFQQRYSVEELLNA